MGIPYSIVEAYSNTTSNVTINKISCITVCGYHVSHELELCSRYLLYGCDINIYMAVAIVAKHSSYLWI